jgi:hypothetical protein
LPLACLLIASGSEAPANSGTNVLAEIRRHDGIRRDRHGTRKEQAGASRAGTNLPGSARGGTAVTVTTAPSRKVEPEGSLLALPLPFVFITSLSDALKVAVTGASKFTLIVQLGLLPMQAPDLPEKTPLPLFAVSVMEDPALTVVEQVDGHLIVLLEFETCPSPTTLTVTG